ncbi:MAG: glycosyltransferase family 4 protein [Proteobacteria bacterium]|nr:glycosyltransferase family 4 protein [Pseudomonadota bacterium]MBU1585761.1 glycosyltransferase family 4 protein [Pseudomonadota bacterium]MBU2452669.1 glycosyltransferase family 4 protein [Pseudomonadota bacterium]MBU2631392.1 glycosyltransferase family 4 protein [Pseudomonadota bacterium]
MIVGIDASNIRAGGGVTHLFEFLKVADPVIHGFSQIIVWSGKATLSRIQDRPWIEKRYQPILDKALPYRTYWQRFRLSKQVRDANCDVLFVPGGSYAGNFRPIVTMSQNLLPFEWHELRRFGWSWFTLKMIFLRWIQLRTFRHAEGVIFLTQYAKNVVMRVIKATIEKTMIIPHGIDKRFICPPREQLPESQYSMDRPFRILYVSIVHVYKHQWNVADAIAQLRKSGFPVVLDLVGPAESLALRRLRATLERIDPDNEFIHYSGAIPYAELHECYAQADAFLFASSCETFGQILTEAMSAGLPIACSNKSAMPELLGDAGMYFDPEKPAEIANAIRKLFSNSKLRSHLADRSFEKVQEYSWERCAKETFSFITQIADNKQSLDPLTKIN